MNDTLAVKIDILVLFASVAQKYEVLIMHVLAFWIRNNQCFRKEGPMECLINQ